MSGNLEQYFQEAVVVPGEERGKSAFTESERAFLEKYMGVDYERTLESRGLTRPAAVESVSGPLGPERAEADLGENPEQALRTAREIQLVSFLVADQEFAVSIDMVQEVIRSAVPTKLPSAPAFISGIMNLRGRVAPLVNMAVLLGLGAGEDDAFTVVCRLRGLRLGLMVSRIASMHRAAGADVEWGVEAKVGVGAAFLAGLLRRGDRLIKIISVDTLFQKVLKS